MSVAADVSPFPARKTPPVARPEAPVVSVPADQGRFPSRRLAYKLSAAQQLTASYSERIQRPQPGDYNPFRVFVDGALTGEAWTARVTSPPSAL